MGVFRWGTGQGQFRSAVAPLGPSLYHEVGAYRRSDASWDTEAASQERYIRAVLETSKKPLELGRYLIWYDRMLHISIYSICTTAQVGLDRVKKLSSFERSLN